MAHIRALRVSGLGLKVRVGLTSRQHGMDSYRRPYIQYITRNNAVICFHVLFHSFISCTPDVRRVRCPG